MNYLYKVVWCFEHDHEMHTTFVECVRRKLSSVEASFDKFFHAEIAPSTLHSYIIHSCDYHGSVSRISH